MECDQLRLQSESQEKEGKESEALRSNQNLPTKVRRFFAFVSWKANPLERADLVSAHEAAVALDNRCKDGLDWSH